MAWAYDAWGWSGWLVAVAIPLCMWAFFAFFVVLVLRRSPAGVGETELATVPDARVEEPRAETGGLGWLPPVPSHH